MHPETGGFGAKLQELLYVEPEELAAADKTRVALVRFGRLRVTSVLKLTFLPYWQRYGSHGIDLSLQRKHAFVPHL